MEERGPIDLCEPSFDGFEPRYGVREAGQVDRYLIAVHLCEIVEIGHRLIFSSLLCK
jgi:hypothetical protein